MVCATCEKKQARSLAAPDPFRNRTASGSLVTSKAGSSSSSASSSTIRPTNKLLTSKGSRFNPLASQCKICKSPTSAGGGGGAGAKAQYCPSCAFKRGCCAICGKVILDIKKGGHKMSS